jgi:hypothetical protein
MIYCGEILHSQTRHRWKYNTAHALCIMDKECCRQSEYVMCIAYRFSSATMFTKTLFNVMLYLHCPSLFPWRVCATSSYSFPSNFLRFLCPVFYNTTEGIHFGIRLCPHPEVQLHLVDLLQIAPVKITGSELIGLRSHFIFSENTGPMTSHILNCAPYFNIKAMFRKLIILRGIS